METNDVVSFSNADQAWSTEVPTNRDSTYNYGYASDTELGNFLARPLKLAEFTWTVGQNLVQSIDPWALFMRNPNVLRRIENFRLFRGDLRIKIMINGNGFYYGRVLCSYEPLFNFRDFEPPLADAESLCLRSQLPHVFLDPTTSQGGEIRAPYFWFKNWADLISAETDEFGRLDFKSFQPLRQANSGTGSVTITVMAWMENVEMTIPTTQAFDSIVAQSGEKPEVSKPEQKRRFTSISEALATVSESDDEDELEPRSRICKDPISFIAAGLVALGAAGFTKEITTLRKRARELELAIQSADKKISSTSKEYGLPDEGFDDINPEAGQKKAPPSNKKTVGGSDKSSDEYGQGIISMPASILARAAGSISNAPVIGKYALATKYALEGVGNIARIFGYSRPPIVDSLQSFKHQPAGLMAVTDRDENVAKLALDSKQELTIDPSTVGLEGTDQMTVGHIVQKESWFADFGWQESDAAEAGLFEVAVQPVLFFSDLNAWPDQDATIAPTPMCHLSQLFYNWRGSITFRFQIVASAFHKGRLRVTYDPYGLAGFNTGNYNVAYNQIIDLAETREFEYTVHWAQPESFKRTRTLVQTKASDVYAVNTINTISADDTFNNGILQVAVVNTLTTPNDAIAAPISINVFVRAGEDFEFANPAEDRLKGMSYFPDIAAPARRNLKVIHEDKETPDYPRTINKAVVAYDDVPYDLSDFSDIKPQSGETPDNGDQCNMKTDTGNSDEADNAPERTPAAFEAGEDPLPPTDETLMVYMGEKVASIRQMLKRYMFHEYYAYTAPSGSDLYRVRLKQCQFPTNFGYAASNRTNSVNGGFSYVNMTMFNWLVPCYAGWRGTLRRKIFWNGTGRANLSVTRGTSVTNANGQTTLVTDIDGISTAAAAFEYNFFGLDGQSGAYAQPSDQMAALEFENPFYSEYRFARTQWNNNSAGGLSSSVARTNEIEVTASHDEITASNSYSGGFRSAVSVGEDFSCFWYLNAPRLYSVLTPQPS